MFSNATQSIPECFRQVIRNDADRAELKAKAIIDFQEFADLREERNLLRGDCERALRRGAGNQNRAR